MSELMVLREALQRHLPAPPLPGPAAPRHLPAQRVAIHHPEAVPAGLSPAVKEAALLLCGEVKQARHLSSKLLAAELAAPISAVPMILGHTNSLLNDEDLKMLSQLTAEMVHRSFPGLTVGEIGLAFRRGASGEWKQPKEVLLPTLQCFRAWLTAYQKGDRFEAAKALQRGAQELAHRQQLLLPPPDMAATYPQQLQQLAAYLKQHGRVPEHFDAGFLLYDWLKKLGAFAAFKTNEELYAMLRKESIRRAGGWAIDKQERKQAQSFGQVLRRGFPAGHPLADSVKNACKKRLFKEWLLYHNARGTNYLTLLEQLQNPPAQHLKAAA